MGEGIGEGNLVSRRGGTGGGGRSAARGHHVGLKDTICWLFIYLLLIAVGCVSDIWATIFGI